MFTANIYTLLDREMVLLEHPESFYTKELCSKLYSIELKFYSQKNDKFAF